MVTLESNRIQSPANAPLEQKTQAFQPVAEAVGGESQAEQRGSISLRDPFWFMSLVVAGATIASMWGLSTLVLAILGLSGMAPMYMVPVASIVVGLAFLTLSGVNTAWALMFQYGEHENSRDRIAFFSGVVAVLIAGLVAAILGILNFVFPGDLRLGAVAVILLGLGMLWQSRVMRRVSHFTYSVTYQGADASRPSGPFAVNALSVAPVRDALAGLSGVILGILAMMNIAPAVLGLVSLLIIGGVLTFSASTICGAALTTLKGVRSMS